VHVGVRIFEGTQMLTASDDYRGEIQATGFTLGFVREIISGGENL